MDRELTDLIPSLVAEMSQLLNLVFRIMEQENIQYCLLRDADELDQYKKEGGEVDFLVRENQIQPLRLLLARLNFIELPGSGYEPHHFFIAFDEICGVWLKLDVITEIVFGKPIPTIRTSLGSNCLAHRQRFGPTFLPAPEDELVTLLLHCVLDKNYFSSKRQQRLKILRQQITNERYISSLLVLYWHPTMTWESLAAIIDTENWTALLTQHEEVVILLSGRDHLNNPIYMLRKRLERKFTGWKDAHRPPSLSLALLAPDGAGKSTLAAKLAESFYFPARTIYMGLYSKQSHAPRLTDQAGLRFARRLLRLWANYFAAQYHLLRRRLVIFDRYPYDALLSSSHDSNMIKRVRHWLLTHPCPAPDLVVILDAPGEILYTRKGEHNPEFLEEQRQAYIKLHEKIPHSFLVDATHNTDFVLRQVTSLIWQGYIKR